MNVKFRSFPVTLRPLRLNDLQNYYLIVRDPQIARLASFPRANNLRQARRLLTDDLRSAEAWAIVLKRNRRMIGVISLYATLASDSAPNLRCRELGYMLNRRFWHQGYMTNALGILVKLLNRRGNVKKLLADVNDNNIASRRVLEKNYFVNYRSVMDFKTNETDLIYELKIK